MTSRRNTVYDEKESSVTAPFQCGWAGKATVSHCPMKTPSDAEQSIAGKKGTPPGIASEPKVHDEEGIESTRASGRLAAQVLEYAGTLVKDGDITNLDVTVYLNGYHGDTSATFFSGNVNDEARKLVQVTKESLDKAISICAPGVEFKKIGRTIHDHADRYGYGVVRQFVGHGVGRVFHADPVVLHSSKHPEFYGTMIEVA
ncbi:hypothetical protein TIFTF001_009663 [Ficus carica]|uniref:Peptidase M24 domain-containing protein n=1 Tax=Ficus carica TaxID=3494 RepID=A0AA88AAT8_FICCA|nr:hypothetical protein TIFTF001_009663 [Ficus carica]